MIKTSKCTIVSALLLLGVFGCGSQSGRSQSDDEARLALDRAEAKWLLAYETHDVDAMDSIVTDGFRITHSSGRIETKPEIIAKLKTAEKAPVPDSVQIHYTEDRIIHILGNTAILSGIYVYPYPDGRTSRSRYTDTWMYLDGRWQVVASHLSQDDRLEAESAPAGTL